VGQARAVLSRCQLCPRCCGADRLNGEEGQCHIGRQALVSNFGPHFGEEAPLVGKYGSGTVFFSGCNLHCIFCQNYDISQQGDGSAVSAEQLAGMMLALQAKGCHNINLVSPTHVVPQILQALEVAAGEGLNLPLVYNTGGYDSVETLKWLDGIVDVYMPDMKYADAGTGERLSGVGDYPQVNQAAVREMHRQVGTLELDAQDIARRGVLVRHLVLPQHLAGTEKIMRFLAHEISTDTYLNIMTQYRPCYRAYDIAELARPVSGQEFSEAVELALRHGLYRLDKDQPSLPPRRIAV
jgi:putative pyruvate formate lyase activating enzyme